MVRKEIGKNPNQLGRAIVRHKALNKYEARRDGRQKTAHYHNTDDQDEQERNNLQSIMERNDLDEFLNQAMMKEQDFTAQKANVVIVGGSTVVSVQHKDVKEQLEYEHIRIPRRPKWDFNMSADELQRLERESFLAWRRELAVYEESSTDKHATPFEKNIEVWKQLWRVAERSHVIAQIVDARNPLLFYCADLFALAKEIDPRKSCVLVINKSDFLTRTAREHWGKFFESKGIKYIFWSALKESELLQAHEEKRLAQEEARAERKAARRAAKKAAIIAEIRAQNAAIKAEKTGVEPVEKKKKIAVNPSNQFAIAGFADDDEEEENVDEVVEDNDDDYDDEDYEVDEALLADEEEEEEDESTEIVPRVDIATRDPYEVVGHQELLDFFKSFADMGYVHDTYIQNLQHRQEAARQAEEEAKRMGRKYDKKEFVEKDDGEKIIIGMLGFPNVGKSSTINALVGAKKVSVSSTAGHTKHFQTLNLGDGLVLCDCPGLVFPTFVHSKATLVINGVIPIDTLRDFISPVEAICQRISRSQIVQLYGLDIPAWKQLDAMTLLTSHARLRGYYKNAGRPDETKSARFVLKDYVGGKLLHCQAPPTLSKEERKAFYHSFSEQTDLFASSNPENRNFETSGHAAAPKHIPVHGKAISSDPLAFEAETEFIAAATKGSDDLGVPSLDGFKDEDRDVINVNISRKKVVTVQPEVEKLSVYENKQSKADKLKELEGKALTKKQIQRMRNNLLKGRSDVIGDGDIVKKGAAGANSSKFFGAVIDSKGKKVKQ